MRTTVTLPDCTDADIRQYTSAESFARGRQYCQAGAVESLVQRGAELEADVWGSDAEPYLVQVTFAADRLIGATCSCPFEGGGWCKHIVAALLVARQQPERVEQRPPLAELLAGLDRNRLQALLLKVAEHEPSVVAVIEAQVPLLAPSPTPVAGPPTGQNPPPHQQVDAKAFRRQVRAVLGIGGGRRSWGAYRRIGSVIAAVAEVLKQVGQLIAAGDGRGALAMLEVITEEFLVVWEGFDDSEGESIDFFEELGGLWAEALLTTDLNAQERRAWVPKLETWQGGLDDYGIDEAFEPALTAAVEGWDQPALLRVLRGEIAERRERDDEAPAWADELTSARLRVLDRQGRSQEYLNLAEAEGQVDRYVTMLARLGRSAEALAYGRAHLTTAQEAFYLATALWEAGELEHSLESAEIGLGLEGPTGALAAWVGDRAAEQGQTERALVAAVIAFEADLSLVAYLKIQELAGPDWPTRRSALLDRLREDSSYYPQGPVEIFLLEGLIDDAIAVVDRDAAHALVEQVADAAIATHPDWVINASRRQAEWIMDNGKSQHYDAAARWLDKARAAHQATDRGPEWQSYLAGLLDRHRRKYSLVPLLRALA